MGPNKFVHLTFALGGLLAAFLLSRAGDWAGATSPSRTTWSSTCSPSLVAGVAAVVAYRNERVLRVGRRGHARAGEGHLADAEGDLRGDRRRASSPSSSRPLILSSFDALWAFFTNWFLR